MPEFIVKTIGQFLDAKKRFPKELEILKKKVTVLQDLEGYLEYVNNHSITTKLKSNLRRGGGDRAAAIHPSSACKKDVCVLKVYNEAMGFPQIRTYDRQTQLIWDIGTMLHDLHQTYFRLMYGKQFKDEVPLEDPELFIKSHTDGIFDFSELRIILEMKSIKEGGNYGFEKVQAKPFDDNVRQAHFYMFLADVPFALIFYICKNNSQYKEHIVEWDADLWDEMGRNVIYPVLEAMEEEKEPEANPGWHCRWCGYMRDCTAAKSKRKGTSDASVGRRWA